MISGIEPKFKIGMRIVRKEPTDHASNYPGHKGASTIIEDIIIRYDHFASKYVIEGVYE
jgi:hypothetical protein